MTALEDRLRSLGTQLDLDDDPRHMVTEVLARVADDGEAGPNRVGGGLAARPWLRVAAGLVVLAAAVAVAVPSSRRTVADWFGLDGVDVERRPDVSVPLEAPAIDDTTPAPGSGGVVDVDGVSILVSEIDGRLDEAVISKTVGNATDVVAVTVGTDPGLWIAGRPHELAVFREDELLFERIAANTLVWQDGPVIRRLEGFDDLDGALEFAATIDR